MYVLIKINSPNPLDIHVCDRLYIHVCMYIHTLLSSLLPHTNTPSPSNSYPPIHSVEYITITNRWCNVFRYCIPNAKGSESKAILVAWRCAGSDGICTVYRTCYIISACLAFLPKVWKLVHMSTWWPQHNTSCLVYVAACGGRRNTLPWEIWGLSHYGGTYVCNYYTMCSWSCAIWGQ